jgi:hypothetical protein
MTDVAAGLDGEGVGGDSLTMEDSLSVAGSVMTEVV